MPATRGGGGPAAVGVFQPGGVQPGVERAVGREDGGRRHVAVGRQLPRGRHSAAAAHRVQLRHQGAPARA